MENDLLEIAIIKIEDIVAILAIENQVHKKPWTEKMLLDSLEKHLCWKLLDDGEIVGYMILMRVDDHLELLNIAISKDHQGKGFAKYLLAHLKIFSQENKITNIFLEVRASNLVAINLYQKQDFLKINLRKNYYTCETGREDALVMCLTLD